jgi:hypothetical protein
MLKEKNRIKSFIFISNKNLVNKLYSLLTLIKREVNILSKKETIIKVFSFVITD